MQTVSTLLSSPIEFLVLPNGVPCPARLRWSSLAPLEIETRFLRPHWHSWYLGRTLVEEALAFGSSGEGDVQFHPDVLAPEYLRMTLRSPNGCACLRVHILDLAEFLTATYDQVRDRDVPLVNDYEIEQLVESYL